jgi:type III secretion protein R
MAISTSSASLSIWGCLLGLLPLLVVSLTGFLKISVVLFLVRNALGIQQAPPNLVLYGIALVLTVYVSTPLIGGIAERYNGHQLEFKSRSVMQPDSFPTPPRSTPPSLERS